MIWWWTARQTLFFCGAVGVYAVYVAVFAVPWARREMAQLVAGMERASEQRWGGSDQWRAAALASTGGLARGPGQVLAASEAELGTLKRRLQGWAGRAAAATQLIEGHLHEFHGFGDVRHARLCFVVEETLGDENATLTAALERLAEAGAGGVHLAVYWAARGETEDPEKRRRVMLIGSGRVRHRRVPCGNRGLDCAALHAYAEGCEYIAAARPDWRLVAGEGPWGPPLVRGFKVRRCSWMLSFDVLSGAGGAGSCAAGRAGATIFASAFSGVWGGGAALGGLDSRRVWLCAGLGRTCGCSDAARRRGGSAGQRVGQCFGCIVAAVSVPREAVGALLRGGRCGAIRCRAAGARGARVVARGAGGDGERSQGGSRC
jgi:hypothetical protein